MAMDQRNYVWFNGQFFSGNQPVLGINNRSFAYGDGLFETIHAYGTQGKHLNLHYDRLTNSMKLINLEMPSFFTMEFLGREITRLLNKNRHFQSTRIRLSVFREDGGFYTPAKNSTSIVLQSIPLAENFYPYNQKGLIVDIFTEIKKPNNILSPLKSSNALLYVMASIYKERIGVDDCLLINEQNRLIEATSSNLFLVIGNQLYTPSLSEGCVDGVMRKLIIQLAIDSGHKVYHQTQVDTDMLNKADELFLSNAVFGIKWIVGIRHKRYFSAVSRKLSQLLNHYTFPDQLSDGFSG
jgi:branched-chain amino acid aminotransferase